MDFDNLYEDLDNLTNEPEKEKCCDNPLNYLCNNGMITCKVCNKQIDNIIDSPEWRYYGTSDTKSSNPTRCGMPVNVLLPNSSIGTSVNSQRGNKNNKIALYQKWNSMPYKERSKFKVFNEINTKCQKGNLPPIISNTANSLYSAISDTKISRGNNRKGIIAACVYNACKECNVPRSIKELSDIFDIDPKILTKGCKNYTEISRINKNNVDRIQNSRSINLNDFIERFCYNLNLDKEDTNIIIKISTMCINEKIIYDNTPMAMACGCIYTYIKLKNKDINKKCIAENCKISEVTINKCYKKIESNTKLFNEIKKIVT